MSCYGKYATRCNQHRCVVKYLQSLHVFDRDWSYIEQFTYSICKNKQRVRKTISPININILKKDNEFTKLAEALLTGGFLTRQCCNKIHNTTITYGAQLFIECDHGLNKRILVEQFPKSIELHKVNYALAGFVMYKSGRSVTSVGYYTAWVKSDTNCKGVEYDDLKPKPLCPLIDSDKKSPMLCIYVRIYNFS